MPGLRQELAGASRIVRRRRRLPVEFEILRENAARQARIAERQRLVHRLEVQGEIGRLAHPPIVPRRLRIPLFREVEPERRRSHRCLSANISLHLALCPVLKLVSLSWLHTVRAGSNRDSTRRWKVDVILNITSPAGRTRRPRGRSNGGPPPRGRGGGPRRARPRRRTRRSPPSQRGRWDIKMRWCVEGSCRAPRISSAASLPAFVYALSAAR